MIERLCKNCHTSFVQYLTTQNLCDDCAYNKNYNTPQRLRKRALKSGKITEQWFEDKALWIKQHPPNHQGYWECYLKIHEWCPKFLTRKTLTLDHVKARSRVPKKRRTPSNFRPACKYCNELKGSLSLAQVRKKYNVKI